MKYLTWSCLFCIVYVMSSKPVRAQEVVAPLQFNPKLQQLGSTSDILSKKKTRAATLPFIDDFAYSGPYPDANLWVDKQAYINNTMGFFPINRGVATLDGLNQYGRPYVDNQNAISKADSLTSVTIDLSSYNPGSDIYLSFFAQPEGLGFSPETKDSLYLYFKNNNNEWLRMWQIRGTGLTLFKEYYIPVIDQQFLHSTFQFRFVNLASPNINDDHWHLDYIRMDANRNLIDSIQNDIGFSVEPTPILAPYTEMPYRHFIVNQANQKTPKQFVTIQNLYPVFKTVDVTHEAKEIISSTLLHTETTAGVPVPAKGFTIDSFQSYTISYTPPSPNDKVVIEDKYFYTSINGSDRKINDTISRTTVFDNHFAYDDGSVEKSYFLLNAFNYPAKTALQFHLNTTDTVRGLAVHFGAQVPTAAGKYFSIVLYKQLAGNGLTDSILHQEDLFQVIYDTTYNGYTYYAFQNPVVADSGWYYIGITQPSNFGSDSIYYGLDVNSNANKDYLYYNVAGTWEASTVTNASIMMRPMVGPAFTPTSVQQAIEVKEKVSIYPNPCRDQFYISGKVSDVALYTLEGQRLPCIRKGDEPIDISNFPDQVLLVVVTNFKGEQQAFKLIKNK